MNPIEQIGNYKLDDILFDIICKSLQDRLVDFPPPPEGYAYVYDFPAMTHNPETEYWDVYADLCLQDRYGRIIRLNSDE